MKKAICYLLTAIFFLFTGCNSKPNYKNVTVENNHFSISIEEMDNRLCEYDLFNDSLLKKRDLGRSISYDMKDNWGDRGVFIVSVTDYPDYVSSVTLSSDDVVVTDDTWKNIVSSATYALYILYPESDTDEVEEFMVDLVSTATSEFQPKKFNDSRWYCVMEDSGKFSIIVDCSDYYK